MQGIAQRACPHWRSATGLLVGVFLVWSLGVSAAAPVTKAQGGELDAAGHLSVEMPAEIHVQAQELLAIALPHGAVRMRRSGSDLSWRVSQLDGLEDGTWLELEAGAAVTLLCRDGGVLEINVSGVVDAEDCAAAKLRSAGAFASLHPDGGRLRAWAGSWALEGETRDDPTDYGLRPVLLAPRCPLDKAHALGCSRLLALPAQVRWVAVAGAEHYILRWAGQPEVQIDPARCAAASGSLPFAVCATPWPADWILAPGTSSSLEVEARLGLFEGVRSETTRLERLEEGEAREIRRGLAEVARLGLGADSESLLSVPVYAQANLLNETVTALERAANEVPTSDAPAPRLDIALADGYRRLDLLYPAMLRYQAVLARIAGTSGQSDLAAAAHLGLAWVFLRQDRRELAEAEALLAESLFLHRSEGLAEPSPLLLADLAEARSLLVRIRQRGASDPGISQEGRS